MNTADKLLPTQSHIVIIGNGIAGITAARTIRKWSDHRITVISSESEYFFSRTALMYVFMGHMRWKDIQPYESWFWKKNNINLVMDHVTSIDEHTKTINTSSGNIIPYDKLILATGSASNILEIPGKDLDGVTGLYSAQDLMYIESKSQSIRRAVIVGGGLIGIELAEMFISRKIPVTLLVREPSFYTLILPTEESEMINRHIREHGIDLRLNSELQEIKANEFDRVKSVITNQGDEIDCQFTGITVGVHPNINWLRSTAIGTNKGILVNEYLQTNLEDIYAIGDCAELRNPPPGRKAIEPVWYTGRIMGETVAHTICGHPTIYQPGIWFNSAKFFNIEYQVYGDIQPTMPYDQKTLFWADEDGRKSVRINYTDYGVIGFNLLGIRFRQNVCEKWIRDKCTIENILEHLELAFFDPEFSKNYAKDIRQCYSKMTGRRILPKTNGAYNRVYAFLKSISK